MAPRRALFASMVLSVAGAGVSAYLIRVHYDLGALICGTGACEVVQTSSYATVMDIPIAIFGLLMYVTVLALAVARLRLPHLELPASTAALGITAAGTLYSGWLTWLELYEINAICQWCVASAVIVTCLFLLEVMIYWRLWSAEPDDLVEASNGQP
jgi:uncharacterized membrane protein